MGKRSVVFVISYFSSGKKLTSLNSYLITSPVSNLSSKCPVGSMPAISAMKSPRTSLYGCMPCRL